MQPADQYRLGILVPSSNTKLEPAVESILKCITANHDRSTDIRAHYTRVRVTQISLTESSSAQFDLEKMLQAASLLVDAGVHAIAWAGTSASWTGVNNDRILCAAITERFGIPATTSTLALVEYMHAYTDERLLLVTPYVQAMNDAIIANFTEEGIEIVDELCLGFTDNREIGRVADEWIRDMIEDIAARNANVKTVVVLCTNLFAGSHVGLWESKEDFAIIDSIVVTMWSLLGKIGRDVQLVMVQRYPGRMFSLMKKDGDDADLSGEL